MELQIKNGSKMTLILGFLVTLLFVGTAPAQTLDLKRMEAVSDSIAHAQLAEGLTPGVSVAVAKNGNIVFERAYGQADVEMDVAASPGTIYRIGSITKQFTAAIIMKLVETDKIALDDLVTKYLPNYPAQGHPVTIRHLLNHTSGMGSGSYTEPSERKAALRQTKLDLSNDELLDLFAKPPFDSEPGEDFEYSNKGYMLLGMIIGEVTGIPYAKYLEQKVLQPLGLNQTFYCDVRRVIPNRAKGYDYNAAELFNASYISMETPGGAGAICSTVGDLIRWTSFLHDGMVVSSASLQQMTAPTVETTGDTAAYGYGLRIGELGDHPIIYHGGSISGFQSSLYHYPEDDLTIAILMNSNNGEPDKMEEALARAAFGMELLDLPPTTEVMARYEGTYTLQSDNGTFNVRVFPKDGRLNAELVGEGTTPLLYQGEGVFIAAVDHNMRLVFTEENGRAKNIEWHFGNAVLSGKKNN